MSLRGSVSRRPPGPHLAPRTAALAATIAFVATIAFATTARAQAQPPAADVGQLAPDFSMPGATRYGMLRDPVALSSFRGKTVVLAYFYKARTKG